MNTKTDWYWNYQKLHNIWFAFENTHRRNIVQKIMKCKQKTWIKSTKTINSKIKITIFVFFSSFEHNFYVAVTQFIKLTKLRRLTGNSLNMCKIQSLFSVFQFFCFSCPLILLDPIPIYPYISLIQFNYYMYLQVYVTLQNIKNNFIFNNLSTKVCSSVSWRCVHGTKLKFISKHIYKYAKLQFDN